MTKAEKAKELFLSGYNCSQSIAGAFCDELGLSFEKAVKLSSGFGGGMGRMREVCGAFSGIVMVLSALEGYDSPNDDEKKVLYEKVQKLAEKAKNENGSIICRELLSLKENENSNPTPQKRTTEYYASRPCVEIVFNTAKVLEEYLESVR